ncbi:hypothetical protein PQC40_gp047 [Escherichia phage EP335]|uniref:Uncharacterized protein n=1 Tax=Escherichia phage EP335 TaxID=2070199 RepID=A0A2Z3DUV4_9CAUD|nr:hypothetical protein PQC40_gp047 [Escherichia phage EP335]AVZ45130.1 hypothetical protein [Escherichia phage EP335]
MEEQPSDWCFRQYSVCKEQGRTEEAEYYLELAQLWKEREDKE